MTSAPAATVADEEAPPSGLTGRVAVLLVIALAAIPHWRALVPGLSYYFRDFSVTFYPLRLFQARELAQGRLPFWNPYIHQGSFVLPALYPVELLHAFWSGPAAVSWLLTLHVPLAGLAAYALARELGARRPGAVVGAAIYALGGLAASSLNLYVFLQALAWAPALAAAARRAAVHGGRWAALLALATAVSLSTMAVEFVAQAILLGIVLGLAASPTGRAAARLAGGFTLGAALAAVPLAVAAGFLGETVRGEGFTARVALGNELHPLALLQVLVPDLFGALDAPAELWWAGRFFTKGFPYFLSIYTGAAAIALAAVGWPRLPRRTRLAMGAVALVALWYSLGARGGLAPLLQSVPALRWFRFPSKALLLPYLVLAPAAALGFDRLRAGEAWGTAARWLAGLGAAASLPVLAIVARRAAVSAWAGLPDWAIGGVLATSATAAAVGFASAGLAVAVRKGALRAPAGALMLAAVAVGELARAHAGINPQVSPRFYEPLPELAALRLAERGRVFSYGPDESPVFRRLMASAEPGWGLWSFFVNRQLLGPYNNILDGVETPEAKDLTSLVPKPILFTREDYDPAGVAGIIERLRRASVAHVLSLDPLSHSALQERAVAPTGVPGLEIHVYELRGPSPRAYVACRTFTVKTTEEAVSLALAADFDPARDAVLETAAGAAGCDTGAARRVDTDEADVAAYEVEADGPGFLVTRERYARGWTALVDGRSSAVLRANGLHRAVAVAAGRHLVRFEYHPPGLLPGVLATAVAVIGILGVLTWPRIL